MSGFTGLKDRTKGKSSEYERVLQVSGSKHQILMMKSHTGPHAGVSDNCRLKKKKKKNWRILMTLYRVLIDSEIPHKAK